MEPAPSEAPLCWSSESAGGLPTVCFVSYDECQELIAPVPRARGSRFESSTQNRLNHTVFTRRASRASLRFAPSVHPAPTTTRVVCFRRYSLAREASDGEVPARGAQPGVFET